MSLTFVAADAVESDSITFGTHQAGDLITVLAYNIVGDVITVPSKYDNVSASNFQAVSRRSAMGQFVATSSSETSGTWTDATHLSYYICRPTAGAYLIAGNAARSGTNNATNMLSPVLVVRREARIVRMLFYDPQTPTGYAAQTDFTNRLTKVLTTATAIVDDSDIKLSTVAGNNRTMTAAVRAHSHVFDILEAGQLSGGGGGAAFQLVGGGGLVY